MDPLLVSIYGAFLVTSLLLFLPANALAQYDFCDRAFDNRCDEARYGGTGLCPVSTDTTDCAFMLLGGVSNDCETANDGQCDEPRYSGTGLCIDGSDTADCAPVLTENSCPFAFNNGCDEGRYGGSGACADGTDTQDCSILALNTPDDSCETANNSFCGERRYGGSGVCRDGTDTSDCAPTAAGRQLDTISSAAGVGGYSEFPELGNNSCDFSFDRECDDARYGGTGLCPDGTDATDCLPLAEGGNDSCRFANDGECDEINLGFGFCATGTDTTDCAAMAFLRNREDSCAFAFNGQCDEPDGGTGLCEARTDTADCLGRERPAGVYDHYFGTDERTRPDSSQMPWRAIGRLEQENSTCTGTLIGPQIVLTAAHCVMAPFAGISIPLRFRAGLSGDEDVAVAGIRDVIASPNFDWEGADRGRGNGNDWAIAILDRDLGSSVGTLPVHTLTDDDLAAIDAGTLEVQQAGYSWDTGDFLSANTSCLVTEAFDDGSILHECDVTNGDSGSPLLLMVDGQPRVIGVISRFFPPEEKDYEYIRMNLAVDTRGFIAALEKLGIQ